MGGVTWLGGVWDGIIGLVKSGGHSAPPQDREGTIVNVYDKAYELAKAMRESQEAKELKEARNRVNADSDAKRMLDDFRSRQRELQQKMMGGEEPQAEDMEKLNKLYEVLSLNPLIHKLFEAERRFTVIFDDVNRIMSEAIQNVIE